MLDFLFKRRHKRSSGQGDQQQQQQQKKQQQQGKNQQQRGNADGNDHATSPSVNFNNSRGFKCFYHQMVKEHRGLPLDRTYVIAEELYNSLEEADKEPYRLAEKAQTTAQRAQSMDNEQSSSDKDDDISHMKMQDYCRPCPYVRPKSVCIEPGICDSVGFKNFLAAFRCKNRQYSRCSGLALAKCIYCGMNECERKQYRDLGCIPPRCRPDCKPFRPITDAKRRPCCKPCGF